MTPNSGVISYASLSEDIERLVYMKAGMYSIPGYDRDDVGQEIRFTCHKAIEKYDPTKNNSTPFHFLARCVDNRLRNLLRDNGYIVAKNKRNDQKAIERAESKKRLENAAPLNEEHRDSIPTSYFGRTPYELIEEIEKYLDSPELIRSLHILINNGPPSIPKKHLRIIKRVIKELYGNG